MERLYSYINSINVLSSISLALVWAAKLFGWNFPSGVVANNYIALTAVYAPFLLFLLQAFMMIILRLAKKQPEYYQRTTALFSFVNIVVYLLFLAFVKFF